jgi:hypothetical protein
VAACHAMNNLLTQKQNKFYHDYKVIVAAGASAGIGVNALYPVQEAMDDPLKTKTITLSCGKLTTGVTVKPWTGILMLRNSSSPETYFQAAFRVQSPWTIKNPDGLNPNQEVIIKEECYVFDFAPDRALRQIAEYASRLNVDETASPENKVAEFINFLPVLAYDGSSMAQIDAAQILDYAMSGTTATLLARRWESALLVNVDNETLSRLMANQDAMNALKSIEGFRNLNQDIETIINKSEAVKKIKKEANDKELTRKQKDELTEDEKEYKSKRKEIQEKLIKFATRIPIFMYLTDYREQKLQDVITQLEPGLFKRVTGLSVKDFETLVSLNLFNGPLMNDAIWKFRRYEDASLVYTGINKHEGENIGLFDTVLTPDEYPAVFENMDTIDQRKVTFWFVHFIFDMDFKDLTGDFLKSFKNSLSEVLKIDSGKVSILGIRPGSGEALVAVESNTPIPNDVATQLPDKRLKDFFQSTKIPKQSTFISYARLDSSVVEKIYDFLKKKRVRPWMDTHELLGGQDWKYEIFQAIDEATGFIFCLSKNSLQRLEAVSPIFEELDMALEKALEADHRIYLIPLRINRCKEPDNLRRFHILVWERDKDRLIKAVRHGYKQKVLAN